MNPPGGEFGDANALVEKNEAVAGVEDRADRVVVQVNRRIVVGTGNSADTVTR